MNERLSSAREPLILPSSGSKRSKSGKPVSFGSASVKRVGCSLGGFRIANHAFFSSCNLFPSQYKTFPVSMRLMTYFLILASNWVTFSSSSMFLGLGFKTTGALGTSSSRLNQSENSDLDAKSFSN